MCDSLIESNKNQLDLFVCGNEDEELVSTLSPEKHSNFEVRKNACYFEHMLEACEQTFNGQIVFETMPGKEGQKGLARLVKH